MTFFMLLTLISTLLIGYGCGCADTERRADAKKAEEDSRTEENYY